MKPTRAQHVPTGSHMHDRLLTCACFVCRTFFSSKLAWLHCSSLLRSPFDRIVGASFQRLVDPSGSRALLLSSRIPCFCSFRHLRSYFGAVLPLLGFSLLPSSCTLPLVAVPVPSSASAYCCAQAHSGRSLFAYNDTQHVRSKPTQSSQPAALEEANVHAESLLAQIGR